MLFRLRVETRTKQKEDEKAKGWVCTLCNYFFDHRLNEPLHMNTNSRTYIYSVLKCCIWCSTSMGLFFTKATRHGKTLSLQIYSLSVCSLTSLYLSISYFLSTPNKNALNQFPLFCLSWWRVQFKTAFFFAFETLRNFIPTNLKPIFFDTGTCLFYWLADCLAGWLASDLILTWISNIPAHLKRFIRLDFKTSVWLPVKLSEFWIQEVSVAQL